MAEQLRHQLRRLARPSGDTLPTGGSRVPSGPTFSLLADAANQGPSNAEFVSAALTLPAGFPIDTLEEGGLRGVHGAADVDHHEALPRLAYRAPASSTTATSRRSRSGSPSTKREGLPSTMPLERS